MAKTTIKLADSFASESELGVKISNSLALGHRLDLHVIIYRLSLKVSLHPVCRINHKPTAGKVFVETRRDSSL